MKRMSGISYTAIAVALVAGGHQSAVAQAAATLPATVQAGVPAAATAAAADAEQAGTAVASAASVTVDEPQDGDDVIVTGTRATGLRASDSPTPIQIVGADALKTVGQTDLIQALAQQLPSLQAQAFGGDQAQFRPSLKLRGLNPNHTLILVDGKRRHGSSSVNVVGGAFGGNAAADLLLLPQDMVERVEVLQDGAAAQYGTDAIAGVINFITKKRTSGGDLNLTVGRYFDQGGQRYDVMGTVAFAPWEGAYVDVTGERRFQARSFRGDLDPRVVDTGVNANSNTGVNGGRYLLGRFPGIRDFNNYPEVNQIAGDGKLQLTNGAVSMGTRLTSNIDLYSFNTYSHKKGYSFQNYRVPTVVFGKRRITGAPTATGVSAACANNLVVATCAATSADIPFPQGFLPQQFLDETDYSVNLGIKGAFAGTTFDLSTTYGKDISRTNVLDSANAALYYDTSTTTAPGYTPRDTHNGDFIFDQWVTTLDLTHQINAGLAEPITLAGGLEYRRESYELKSGELASYYIGTGVAGGGIQSFFGYAPSDASLNRRHVFAQYLDVSVKPIDRVFIEGAVRHENYDDFGDTTIFKLTGRFDLSPAIAIRGTASTGFRAPTLAEGFYSGVNVGPTSITGVFPPNSAGAAALGISNLGPEKSTNFSAGLVLHPIGQLTVTIDGYYIKIRDRIVPSSTFLGYSNNCRTNIAGAPCTAIVSPSVVTALRGNGVPVDSVIAAIDGGAAGTVGVSTFVNGIASRTQGIDILATYPLDLGNAGRINLSLSGNYNQTKILSVNPPPTNIDRRQPVFDVYAQSSLTDTTPRYRVTASGNWRWDQLSVNLRESYYGSQSIIRTLPNDGVARYRQTINPQFITDLEIGYQIIEPVKLSIGANNLFNNYPTEIPKFIRDQLFAQSSTGFITRYPTDSAIGINGGYYYARLNLSF
jgi:iron complex outermembrane receptor protein